MSLRSSPVGISRAGPAGLAAAITVARAGGGAVVFERHGDVDPVASNVQEEAV